MSDDRLFDLLAQEATQPLTDAEAQELDALLPTDPTIGRDEFALAAAAVDLALLETPDQELPASIRALAAAAAPRATSAGTASSARPSGRMHWFPIGIAAAAVAMIAFGFALRAPQDAATKLIATAPDAIRGAWVVLDAVKNDYPGVTGEVIWSDAEQKGYMRFRNLPVNNPTKSQYQLWIVDSKRDKHPVDGGVFDANADGEILVPIDAKLRIDEPAAFVITREQPGGVVVSAGPHLIMAQPKRG